MKVNVVTRIIESYTVLNSVHNSIHKWHFTKSLQIYSILRNSYSGSFPPSGKTCRTFILIREVCKYLWNTGHSASACCRLWSRCAHSLQASCSPAHPEAAAWSSSGDKAARESSPGSWRILGTAWYANLDSPDITTMSPLRRNISTGLMALVLPPSRKMADWPKLQFTKT